MKNQLLYDDKWVQLKRIIAPELGINGYTYSHEIRCDGKIISILPFKIKDEKFSFLLRREATPCWGLDKPILSSITGGVDKGFTESQTAVKELSEESGYNVNEYELIFLGKSYGTKSCDTVYTLYSVNLTDKDKTSELKIESDLDESAACFWLDNDFIFDCMDPLVSVTYTRLMKKFSDGLLI